MMSDPEIIQIQCGGNFCMVLKRNGEVYGFGDGNRKKLYFQIFFFFKKKKRDN